MKLETPIPQNRPQSLLLTASEAARLLGICRAKLFTLNSAGRTPRPIRALGSRCPRWRRDELAEWVNAGCPPRDEWEKRARE